MLKNLNFDISDKAIIFYWNFTDVGHILKIPEELLCHFIFFVMIVAKKIFRILFYRMQVLQKCPSLKKSFQISSFSCSYYYLLNKKGEIYIF
jgi:hypothetical protein